MKINKTIFNLLYINVVVNYKDIVNFHIASFKSIPYKFQIYIYYQCQINGLILGQLGYPNLGLV